MINHVFIAFSALEIYDPSNIHLYSSPSTGILRTHNVAMQFPFGLIAQLVEHCTGIVEIMGS